MKQPEDTASDEADQERVFGRRYRALTFGILLSVGLVAFESMGIATVLPGIAADLDGLNAYGWGLSALMLANIVGTVLAGQAADRRGSVGPYSLALAVFAAGCVLAGSAGNWPLFLAGRCVQGLGVGAVMALAYVTVGRAYPKALRARALALLSAAWTLPALVGPPVAGLIAEHLVWRGVFVLLLPLIVVAAALTLPSLRALSPTVADTYTAGGRHWWRGPVANSFLLAFGTAAFLTGIEPRSPWVMLPMVMIGGALMVTSLRRVTPAGTLKVRAGAPAGIVVRGLLCAVYFGSEAFLPLGMTELRQLDAVQAGLGLSAGALTWVAGSALQARWESRRPDLSRMRSTALGFGVLLAGVLLMAAGVLINGVPAAVAILGWAVGGLGMGVAYNATTTEVVEQTPADRQGEASAALQLSQTLSTAMLSGVGGALVAATHANGGSTRTALVLVYVAPTLLALLGIPLARRIRQPSTQPT